MLDLQYTQSQDNLKIMKFLGIFALIFKKHAYEINSIVIYNIVLEQSPSSKLQFAIAASASQLPSPIIETSSIAQ